MKFYKLVVTILIANLAACGGTPRPPGPIPTPTPKPTPPPTSGVVNAAMLLHREGNRIVQSDGHAFDFRGAKTCCDEWAGEPNMRWPVGSIEASIWLKAEGNINMKSIRVGPFRTVEDGETSLAAIGGGYLEVSGKADLTQWNPVFWKYGDDLVLSDATRDQWDQVGLVDGWGLKNECQAGIKGYNPWFRGNNLQATSHCALVFDAVQERWVRKVVEVYGRHGNVVWEVSNESSLVGGDVVAWEQAIIAVVKDEEAKRGYPHHLIASNAQRLVPSADWNEWHTNGSSVAPSTDGKITGVNEYNPEPPLSASTLAATYCGARNAGVYYWAWRHGMKESWKQALNLIRAGCGGSAACPHPDFEQGHVVAGNPDHLEELGLAFQHVRAEHPEWWAGACLAGGGTPPGDDPAHAAERWARFEEVVDALAADMRKQTICAWQQRRVEIHSLRPDKLWTELHSITTNNGCQSTSPYKNTWSIP